MKRYIFACLGALLAPCTATAQQWTQTDNAGTRVAAIVADTSELRVTCAPAGAGIQNALTLRLAGVPANGPVEFTFDNSTAQCVFLIRVRERDWHMPPARGHLCTGELPNSARVGLCAQWHGHRTW